MSADIFGHKTGIARCYESSKKVQAKLIFRTPAVYGIEKNIGVDDERHCVLFHDPFKCFAVGQVDAGPTHIEDRQAKRLFRFRSCSGGQTLRNEFVDQIGHRPSLSSGQIFQSHHLSVVEAQRRPSHTDICILNTDVWQSSNARKFLDNLTTPNAERHLAEIVFIRIEFSRGEMG
jgi:hypothetical protein